MKEEQEMTATLTPAQGTVHGITIFESNREAFSLAARKLNKSLEKKGFSQVEITFGETFKKKVGEDCFGFPIHRDAVLAAVLFKTAKIGNWSFVAKAESLAGQAIVSLTPHHEGRDLGPRSWDFCRCDHCGHRRNRNSVFILEDSAGQEIQVGSTCLKDFLGYDPTGLLWAFSAFRELLESYGPEDDEKGPRGVSYHTLQAFCSATACAIRSFGWVSATKAREEGIGNPTSIDAANILRGPFMGYTPPKPEKQDAETAAKAIEWAGKLPGASDFERNLKVLVAAGYVTSQHQGLAAAIVGCYLRETAKIAERAAKAQNEEEKVESTYFGTIGKRESIKVTVVSKMEYPSDWGVSTLVRMRGEGGQSLIWWASSSTPREGQEFILTGTVKKHERYTHKNGDTEKQTVVNRCKGF